MAGHPSRAHKRKAPRMDGQRKRVNGVMVVSLQGEKSRSFAATHYFESRASTFNIDLVKRHRGPERKIMKKSVLALIAAIALVGFAGMADAQRGGGGGGGGGGRGGGGGGWGGGGGGAWSGGGGGGGGHMMGNWSGS